MSAAATSSEWARAWLAGGCFWGLQELLRHVPGVMSTRVGYTGGALQNPTYEDLHDGRSGHAEAVEIVFDPQVLSYERLLAHFFQMHDPCTRHRQGNDVGSQYRSAIFCADDAQAQAAHRLIRAIDASGRWPGPVVTEVVAAGPFWAAEPEHQDYLQRHPHGYSCHFVRDDWVLPS